MHGARCPGGDGARIQAGRSDKMSIAGLVCGAAADTYSGQQGQNGHSRVATDDRYTDGGGIQPLYKTGGGA